MPNAPFLAPERDSAFKVGRAKGAGTTYYSIPGVVATVRGSHSSTSGTDFYAPWAARTPIIIDQLVCEVTTTGGTNHRMGFYAADTNWQPVGAPLADSGNLDSTTTGIKTYTPGTAIFVPRGRYVSVFNADNASLGARSFLGTTETSYGNNSGVLAFVNQLYVTRAYAAFPTPGTAWDTVSLFGSSWQEHIVMYRVSQP